MPEKEDIQKVLTDLQNLVGPSPKIEVAKFSNWASTQVREGILSVSPTTVEEVQAVVRAARTLGLRVRAAGRTHSWTPLFSDEGDIVMHMRELNRPDGPRIEFILNQDDPDSRLVTIATGVTTEEFAEFQLSHGICIPANVILRVVQMGGVVAPACHGVGWDTQTVSDGLVSMRIVDSNGDLKTYSMKDDPDMMRAVQCNLGLWGIIVDLTLAVSPMIMVETNNVWMKTKDVFYDKEAFRKIVHDNWSVQIFWFPFNGISAWESLEAFMEGEIDVGEWDPKEDEVWLRIINKPDKVGAAESNHFYKSLDFRAFIEAKGFQFVDGFITTFPQCAPSFLRSQVANLKQSYDEKTLIQQLPNAIHFRDCIEDVPVCDMEWAFSIDDDFSNVITAIQGVVDLVYKEAIAGRFPMNLPLELRFIADSEVYMAPSIGSNHQYGGSGHTCQIEVVTLVQTPHWYDFCEKVAEVWKPLSGARPHWCKEWGFLQGIDDFIHKSYAATIPKYLGALERSGADPDGIFLNDRLEKIFYPGGHPGWAKVQATKAKDDGVNGGEKGALKRNANCTICKIL